MLSKIADDQRKENESISKPGSEFGIDLEIIDKTSKTVGRSGGGWGSERIHFFRTNGLRTLSLSTLKNVFNVKVWRVEYS